MSSCGSIRTKCREIPSSRDVASANPGHIRARGLKWLNGWQQEGRQGALTTWSRGHHWLWWGSDQEGQGFALQGKLKPRTSELLQQESGNNLLP